MSASNAFWLFRDGKVIGPFTKYHLMDMAERGEIDIHALVLPSNLTSPQAWTPFSNSLTADQVADLGGEGAPLVDTRAPSKQGTIESQLAKGTPYSDAESIHPGAEKFEPAAPTDPASSAIFSSAIRIPKSSVISRGKPTAWENTLWGLGMLLFPIRLVPGWLVCIIWLAIIGRWKSLLLAMTVGLALAVFGHFMEKVAHSGHILIRILSRSAQVTIGLAVVWMISDASTILPIIIAAYQAVATAAAESIHKCYGSFSTLRFSGLTGNFVFLLSQLIAIECSFLVGASILVTTGFSFLVPASVLGIVCAFDVVTHRDLGA